MLERQSFSEARPASYGDNSHEESGMSLTPSYFLGVLKRRALYFIIPFLLIALIGSIATIVWPSRYLSEGTILVSSQEIPSDLVRPTVAALANERIQIIQQRIMTRNNLLAIGRKFQIAPFWQSQMSGSDLADFIRSRIEITAVTDRLLASPGTRKNAIAFKVGFEYEKPQIAVGVANELVTMILNEDVRSRTEFATQTTQFLEQEVNRLEAKLGLINRQISEYIKLNPQAATSRGNGSEINAALTALRAELSVKSATLSNEHPDIKALKRKIEALEKAPAANVMAPNESRNGTVAPKSTLSSEKTDLGIDTLETQRASVREELTKAIQKVSAARMGESMERSQQSERLEIIEQPTMPQRSIKPNKPKLLGFIFAFAIMAGGGLVVVAEALDKSIRSRADVFSIIDSHLVFAVPYIATPREQKRGKKRLIWTLIFMALSALGIAGALIYILPPIDVMVDKAVGILTH